MKNNKFLNALFALDVWIASTIITTIIINMVLQNNRGLIVTFATILAVVNAIFWSLIVVKFNSKFFSNKKEVKRMIKN